MSDKQKKDKDKPKKKKRRVLKVFLLIILIIIMSIGSFLAYSTYKNGWGLQGVLETMLGQDEEKLKNLDEFRVLIMGASVDISVKLTDTIMVASYNPKTQKATLLSIPRDTYVGNNKKKADSYDKINALYQKSPEKTLEAVNKLTGLNIKYYLVIDTDALIDVVDAIGGVEFDVPIDMDYDDVTQDLHIHLKAGYQKLDGAKSEQLVRFRHNNNGTSYPSSYGDNDIGRMRTQREFTTTVVKQTLQPKNITKIGKLMDILYENVETNLDLAYIKDYIPYLVNFSTEDLQTETLPGEPSKINSLWFYECNEKKTAELISELYTAQNEGADSEEQQDAENTENSQTKIENTEEKINNNKDVDTNSESHKEEQQVNLSNIKIELLNGSGDSKLLTTITNKLKNKGYNVYKTGTTKGTTKTTIINKTSINNEVTSDLQTLLGIGIISNSSNSTSGTDITIIIGTDYK